MHPMGWWWDILILRFGQRSAPRLRQSLDLFFDHPLANGDGVSVQGDVVRYNGGRTFASFPWQDTWLGELGYFSKVTRLTPFIQVAAQRFAVDSIPDQRQAVAGLAWFICRLVVQ